MLLNGGPVAGASRVEFHGVELSEADQTVYTFSGVDIGDAEPSRIVLVAVYQEVATPLVDDFVTTMSVTIGGVDAEYYFYHDNETNSVEMWLAVVPEGATADIVVEANTELTRCEIATWSAYNQDLGTYDYPSQVSSTSYTIPLFEGGCAFVAAIGSNTITGFDSTFTGTYMSGAHLLASGADPAHAYTVSPAITYASPWGGLSIGP